MALYSTKEKIDMKFGIYHMNSGCCANPEAAVIVGKAAEEAGFESLWVGDHIVFPNPPDPRYPQDPFDHRLDALIALAFLAAHTQSVKLGAGVIVLPQRNPLVLSKTLASLDAVSNGRLIFGFGVGHLRPELEALGVPYHERGARTDESLAAIKSLLQDQEPAYSGQYVNFANVQSHPQRQIPIVGGGEAEAALRRIVQNAHGWYGFYKSVEDTRQLLAKIDRVLERVDRPLELGDLEISITPPRIKIDKKLVADYAALGVERLILIPDSTELEGRLRFIEKIQRVLA